MNGISHLSSVEYKVTWVLEVLNDRSGGLDQSTFLINPTRTSCPTTMSVTIVLGIYSTEDILRSYFSLKKSKIIQAHFQWQQNPLLLWNQTRHLVLCGNKRGIKNLDEYAVRLLCMKAF